MIGPGIEPGDAAPVVRQLDRRTRTAQIPHECDLCKSEIRAGQRYTRIFALSDGTPLILKYHEARPPESDECRFGKKRKGDTK